MAAFRRVEGVQAGPAAIGILVPPGRRTVLILRPRSLDCDLLLLALPGRPVFRELNHDEAESAATSALRALQDWSAGGRGRAEPVARLDGGYHVRVTLGSLAFLACPRAPGQPYEPLVCPDADEAEAVACALFAVLHPDNDAEQEVYFNTRQFSRGET